MEISGSLMSMGVQTMQASQQKMSQTAQEIAAAPANSLDNIANLTEQLMQMEQAEVMHDAGAKMVSTADEVLGTTINVMA